MQKKKAQNAFPKTHLNAFSKNRVTKGIIFSYRCLRIGLIPPPFTPTTKYRPAGLYSFLLLLLDYPFMTYF